ncbi:MAG: oligosaccharide flippase family protein [Deltaproteobacteria bacterium]|nr:oligosaccharide flippase family protein [Deltaproteobacteria bacterium]
MLWTRRIRRNVGWKTLGVAAEKSLRFLLVALISRALGVKMYGQYTYAVALALLWVQMTDMGLGLFLAREVSRHEVPPAKLIGHVFTIKMALALAYILVVAGLTWWHFADPEFKETATFHPRPGALGWTVALTGLSGLAASTIEAMWQVFRGVQQLGLEAKSSSVFAGAQLACVSLALAVLPTMPKVANDKGYTMVLIAAAMLVASLVALAYTAMLLFRVVTPKLGWSRPMLQRFAREVLPLGVAIVASLIYFKIDVPMLRMLRGDVDVGLYNAAYKVLENLSVVPAILMAATFPALVQKIQDDPVGAAKLHAATRRVLLVAGLAGALVLLALPELLIRILNGDAFLGAVPVLRALAPSVVLTFVNYLETHMLVAMGLVRAQMAFALALIAVNVTANLAFIPLWGGVGSACATALTEVVLLWFCVRLVRKELGQRVATAMPAEAVPA